MGATSGRLRAAVGLEFADADLEQAVRAGLDEVEDGLRTTVASADSFVTEAARHLVDAGGKRFRPLLVLLAARFGSQPDNPEVVQAALVVELTHLGTLYHDDVMDEATVRRGAPSANARWTNTVAILTGDYLFARASDIVAGLGPAAVRIQASTFSRLVHGQIWETVGPGPGTDPVEHYLRVIDAKTASLLATSARFGGMFADAEPSIVDTLAELGETFGMAFQLSDDVLDIASDEEQSGKTPGTDLREGILTLPILYALAGQDSTSHRLRQIITGPVVDDRQHAEALALLRSSPGLDQARVTLRGYAGRARSLLTTLPALPARDALESLCDFLVKRTG